VGLDDYGIIQDRYGFELVGSRTVGHSWQTSQTASDFKELLDAGYAYAGIWAMTSSTADRDRLANGGMNDDGIGGARTNQANVAALTSKLTGGARQAVQKSGSSETKGNDLNAVISHNSTNSTTYVLVYNHNEDINATSSETVNIILRNISANTGDSVTINRYILDSTHSNFFNVWWEDRGKEADNLFSKQDVVYPHFLKNAEDVEFWRENEKKYSDASEIGPPETTTVIITDKMLTLQTVMTHHSVVLYEITNSKID